MNQKARPIRHHSQKSVKKKFRFKSGNLEKVQKVDENCFVFLVVITVKKDNSFEIASYSRKLNDSCTKMRPRMPNLKKLMNRISTEITRAPNKPLWITKLDLECAYGQWKLCEWESKHCNVAIMGWIMNGHYRFWKKSPWFIRYTEKIPWKKRQNIELWKTCVARGYNNSDKRGQGYTTRKIVQNTETISSSRLQGKRNNIRNFPNVNHSAGTRDNQTWNKNEPRQHENLFTIKIADIKLRIKNISWSNAIHCKQHT